MQSRHRSMTQAAHRSIRPATRYLCTGNGLALALVLLAGGCATTSSTQPAQSPQQRAANTPAQSDEFAKLGYRVEWRGFPTMLPGEKVHFFEILGDVLAVQETAGVVSVLETRSGQTRWSDQVAGRLTKFVGITRGGEGASSAAGASGNRLIVSSESEVYFYDINTGTLKNKQHLAQVVNTRPVQVGDFLCYGCANGQILGHLILNGFRAWSSGLTGSIDTDPVLIGAPGSTRFAIASTTGDLAIMDGQTGLSQGRARMFGGPGADLAASDTNVYIASNDQSLYAFNAESATPIWRKRTENPLTQKPTFNDGKLYCDMGSGSGRSPGDHDGSTGAGGLTCFDALSGKQLWNNPQVHGEVVAMRNHRLVVWDGATGMAATLDPAKGATIDTVKLDNTAIVRPDAFADGNLYVVSPNGIVAKLSPK